MRSLTLFSVALFLGVQGLVSIANAQNQFPAGNLGNLQRINPGAIPQQTDREPARSAPPPQAPEEALAPPTEVDDATANRDDEASVPVRDSENLDPSCPRDTDEASEPGIFEVETEIEPIPSAAAC
jgi:hypothetical protein